MNAIEINNLTKIYRLYKSHKDRLWEIMSLNSRKLHHDFYALEDVSLNIEKGETVGIIGHNGSGKSTLLKLICGVTKPTSGSVKVNGRISSLLELGAGFHQDFTGRENVYMNGALLGFSKEEMESRLPEIEAFANIGEFIDQPVKSYSSGMYMRLAFAAAINVDPDILVIDEILAVGDENFQSKCLQKIQEMRESGKTIFLVSHNISTIENICHKTYLFDHGKCIGEGKPADVIPLYYRTSNSKDIISQTVAHNSNQRPFRRWGTKDVEITNVYFWDRIKRQKSSGHFRTNEELVVRIEFTARKQVRHPTFGVAIHHSSGIHINGSNTKTSNIEIPVLEGEGLIEYSNNMLPLMPGKYMFSAAIYDSNALTPYDHWDKCLSFMVEHSEYVRGQLGILYLIGKWNMS